MPFRLSPLELCLALAVCFLTPLVHWFTVGPHLPHPTYLLLSQLGPVETLTDPSKIIYTFARPPIYVFLGWVQSHPAAFMTVGFLVTGLLCFCIFLIAMSSLTRMEPRLAAIPYSAVALVLVVSVYPLGLASGLASHGTGLIPLDFFNALSNRSFFYIPIALAFLCVLERRDKTALLLAAASCYCHLTAGVLALGLLTLIVFWRLKQNWRPSVLLVWGLAGLIGAIPPLTQFLLFEFPPELQVSMADSDWYSQAIKDEADDFSVIFQLLYRSKPVATIMAVLATTLLVYALLFKDYRRELGFFCLLAIPILFLAAGAYEYLFGVLYPSPLIRPLIGLTPGYRLLSFAFFPLIVLGVRILAVLLDSAWTRLAKLLPALRAHAGTAAALFIVGLSLGLLRYGAYSGGLEAGATYGQWALGAGRVSTIDAYLAGMARTGSAWYPQPPIYRVEGDYVTYPGEANLLDIRALDETQPARQPAEGLEGLTQESFFELVTWIRTELPPSEGLYVPPYLRGFRSALPDHNIYFQEHWDGNWMMGSSRFMKFWNERMEVLLGATYEDLPSKHSGLIYSAMRDIYLAIDEERARSLHVTDPAFRFFITEPRHRLAFPAVFENSAFVIYDLAGG